LTAAIIPGIISPEITRPLKSQKNLSQVPPAIASCQPSNTRLSRKSKCVARPDETHPPRGLPGYQATFWVEQFGAPFYMGNILQKQAIKEAGSGGLLAKNQRSNIPSYFLESLHAPDALNGPPHKRSSRVIVESNLNAESQ